MPAMRLLLRVVEELREAHGISWDGRRHCWRSETSGAIIPAFRKGCRDVVDRDAPAYSSCSAPGAQDSLTVALGPRPSWLPQKPQLSRKYGNVYPIL
jgi:hypothetical protein